jgi:hypothetical protein
VGSTHTSPVFVVIIRCDIERNVYHNEWRQRMPEIRCKPGCCSLFCNGASTQQIAAHVGTFQRGGTRLDREGRDYWIKPLRDIGAVEPIYLQPETGAFILGHPIARHVPMDYGGSHQAFPHLGASQFEIGKGIDSDARAPLILKRAESSDCSLACS